MEGHGQIRCKNKRGKDFGAFLVKMDTMEGRRRRGREILTDFHMGSICFGGGRDLGFGDCISRNSNGIIAGYFLCRIGLHNVKC